MIQGLFHLSTDANVDRLMSREEIKCDEYEA